MSGPSSGCRSGLRNILADMADSSIVPIRVVQALLGVAPVSGEIAVALRILLLKSATVAAKFALSGLTTGIVTVCD